jgi:hypothetical protein
MVSAADRKWRKYRGEPELSPRHAPSAPASLLGRNLLAELRGRGFQVLGQDATGAVSLTGPYIMTIVVGATGQNLCASRHILCLGLCTCGGRPYIACVVPALDPLCRENFAYQAPPAERRRSWSCRDLLPRRARPFLRPCQ